MAISTGCSITVCSACLVTRSGSSASGGRPGSKNTLDGITSTRADDDDRLRLPPIPSPQSSGTEKKESQDRHHNQACRPSGKRSSISSHDLHPDNVLTVTGSLRISPSLKCHVWTAPAVQEESDISAKRSGAAMYPAF